MSRFLSLLLVFVFFQARAFDEKLALKDSQAAIGRQIGDYRFTASDGRAIALASLRGKPLVVNFVYTGCAQVCPTATREMARAVAGARRALGPGTFRVATIGFNQPFDTPAAMRDFARKLAIDEPDWLYLSADAKTIPPLAAEFGFRYEATAAGFDHLLQASILDADGRVYRQLYGDAFDAPQFTGPLLELLRNAPRRSGGLAAMIDDVRLLCTVYDPASGRYRVNYAVLIEILVGASVMLAGIGFVAREWRRRRRATSA